MAGGIVRRNAMSGAYIVAVAACAILAMTIDGDGYWFVATLVLTLPLSAVFLYPVVFVADAVASLTGGDGINGNGFSAAAIVGCYVAFGVSNLFLARIGARACREIREWRRLAR